MKSIRWKILIPVLIVMTVSMGAMLGVITLRNQEAVRRQVLENAEFALDMVYQKVEAFDRNLQYTRRDLEGETREKITYLLDGAMGTLESFYQRALRGDLTEAQARTQAVETIRTMLYGDDGYFFIDDLNYINILNPPNPSTEGLYRGDTVDVRGTLLIKELVNVAVEDGGGFINYWFPKPGETEPSEKISASRYFEPWGWVIGTGIYIDDIEDALIMSRARFLTDLNVSLYERTFMGSYPFIKDRKGTYIAYVERSLVGQVKDSQDTVTGESLNDRYFANDEDVFSYNYTRPGQGDRSFTKLAFVRQYKPLDWVIVYSVYEDDIFAQSRDIRNIILISGGIFLLILMGSVFFVVRRVTRQLKDTAEVLLDISEGEGDLTRRLTGIGHDEVGRVARHFNSFVEKLQETMKSIKTSSGENQAIGQDLAASATEISSIVEEINATMISLREKTEVLNRELQQSRAALEDNQQQMDQVDRQIEGEGAIITESSATIEEMIASIKNLGSGAGEKQGLLLSLSGQAEEGRREMEITMEDIGEVNRSGEVILELLTMIDGIVDQIGLLSMNAAIEAAHAGDAGKGFSVVADEIRKLAETTGDSAGRISASVKDVLGRIVSMKERAGRTQESIGAMTEGIIQVTGTIQEVVEALKEISAGSDQILAGLGDMVGSSSQVKETSGQVKERSRQMADQMVSLGQLSDQNYHGIQEISQGMKEIAQALSDLSALGTRNSDNILKLNRELGQFKTE